MRFVVIVDTVYRYELLLYLVDLIYFDCLF